MQIAVGFKLPAECSSTSTELMALVRAVEWAAGAVQGRPVILLCDSRSAIHILRFGDHTTVHSDLVLRGRSAASRVVAAGGVVLVEWLPSHCGWRPHDAADCAAGEAASLVGPAEECCMTLGERRRQWMLEAKENWRIAWQMD